MNTGPASAAIRAVLLDIEGTTTPMAFVTDVLFPYARRRLRPHVQEHARASEYEELFDRLRDDHGVDRNAGESVPSWVEAPRAERLASVIRYVEWLMDRDRKSTALKALQGKIWQEGYDHGGLVSSVFDDVPGALERWHAEHLQIGIFSSGSVLAQQLLFRHTSAGDLTRFIHHYFDTTIGPKPHPDSYRRIATTMAIPAGAIVFLSDVTRELDAALRAGMQTRLSIRPGNPPVGHAHGHTEIRTFEGAFDTRSALGPAD